MLNFFNSYPWIHFVVVLLCGFFITSFIIPSIIHVAKKRHLYDDLGCFRKKHDNGIPRLGGVAIFVGFTITILLLNFNNSILPVNYLLTTCIILFTVGLKDDLSGVNAKTKFGFQFVISFILVVFANVRLTTFFGFFDGYELPYFVSVILSMIFIVFVINAYNLIDGIDGLASVSGIITNITFTLLFIYTRHYQLAMISLSMVGGILGFLRYNITPAKIFMGDTGSLLIGLISSVMAIKFMQLSDIHTTMTNNHFSPLLGLSVLIGPIFDTLRVILIRVLSGTSPFVADRNHMHHRMQRLGLNHLQITSLLGLNSIFCIAIVLFLANYDIILMLTILSLILLFSNWMITFYIRSKEREKLSVRNLFL